MKCRSESSCLESCDQLLSSASPNQIIFVSNFVLSHLRHLLPLQRVNELRARLIGYKVSWLVLSLRYLPYFRVAYVKVTVKTTVVRKLYPGIIFEINKFSVFNRILAVMRQMWYTSWSLMYCVKTLENIVCMFTFCCIVFRFYPKKRIFNLLVKCCSTWHLKVSLKERCYQLLISK